MQSLETPVILLAGIFLGLFTFPLKRTPQWEWEHTWGVGSLFGLLLFPLPLLLAIPNPELVYQAVPSKVIVQTALFGLAWAFGGLTLGLAVDALGTALGISLVTSIATVFGSLGPMVLVQPAALLTERGYLLIAGLAVMVLGIVICGTAGKKRELDRAGSGAQEAAVGARRGRKSFVYGLTLCVVSGFLSSLLNFAFVMGAPLKQAALAAGASPLRAPNAIWSLVFTANFAVNALYCAFLIMKKRSWRQLKNAEMKYWGWALFLGGFWGLSIVSYGAGAETLGSFGAYAGYPMFLVYTILVSNSVGALSGEWKGTYASTKRTMKAGVLILVLATVLLGYSASLST